ncbi:hypothetical protein Ancab_016942 [Ancistrocladus abbreviatus]
MKTVLQKSFKSAKCKTTLKLAVSRIKLMKNKKAVQLKQLKGEVAQLLQSGQDQTARIRVEHVIREEKTMAAYDLIEIYCELIVARLPIIESQKNCPIDLKEAVASIIFASPRCADIPELADVRKHFTVKYGKEFVTAAMELRPECGVNRILVEKLSAIAPDGPTKVKILTAIASEHNMKWEPDWFKDKDREPPADLLSKANIDKASKMHVEPPTYGAAPTIEREHEIPPHVHDTAREGDNSSNFPSTDVGSGTAAKMMMFNCSSNKAEDTFSVGRQDWNMEFEDATAAAQAAAESAERASMAARAAAELSSRGRFAKHASTSSAAFAHGWSEDNKVNVGTTMQRRQLERNSTNDSNGGRSSTIHSEQRELDDQAKLTRGVGEVSLKNEHNGRTSRILGEKRDLNNLPKLTRGAGEASLKNDGTQSLKQYEIKQEDDAECESYQYFANSSMREQSEVVDTISPESSNNEFEASVSSNRQEYQNELAENPFYRETVEARNQPSSYHSQSTVFDKEYGIFSNLDQHRYGNDSEEPYVGFDQGNVYGGELEVREQPRHLSSHSGVFCEENNEIFSPVAPEHGNDSGEGTFLVVKQGSIKVETRDSDTNSSAAVVFDDSGSDDDMVDLDAKHDMQNSLSDVPSTPSKWSTHFSLVQDGSPTNDGVQSALYSSRHPYEPEITDSFRKSSLYMQLDHPLPVAFDDSDGPSSETEEEPLKSQTGKRTDSTILNADSQEPQPPLGTSHVFRESSSPGKKTSRFSSGSVDAGELFDEDHGTKFDDVLRNSLGSGNLSTSQQSLGLRDSRSGTSDLDHSQSFSSLVDEGMNQPSAHPSRLVVQGSVQSTITTDSNHGNQSSVETVTDLNLGLLTGGLRNKRYKQPPYRKDPLSDESSSSGPAADITSSTNEQLTSRARNVRELTGKKLSTKVNDKASIRIQDSYVDSVDDDFETKLVQKVSGSVQESDNKTPGSHVDKRSNLRASAAFFDSDDSSAEEDVPKPAVTTTGHLGSGFSRRTRDSVPRSAVSHSFSRPSTEASAITDYVREKKPSLGYPHATETLAMPRSAPSSHSSSGPSPEALATTGFISENKHSASSPHAAETLPMPQRKAARSGLMESSEHSRRREQATSRPGTESKISSKISWPKETSAKEKPTGPSKDVTSGGSATEGLNTSNLSTKTPSRENSDKKASHVHPKLPDYDTIAAQMQSLRMNRQ